MSSTSSLKRKRAEWDLKGTRQQNHTFETIEPFIKEAKERFSPMGARQLVAVLRRDYKLKVPEYVLFSCSLRVYSRIIRHAFSGKWYWLT